MKKIILILCGLALFASPVLAVTVTTTNIDWATYNTEARKLCRFPSTSNLALVYTDGYEGNYNCYYVASNDLGFNWSGNELIAKGQYPSLSVHPGLGFQWYLYSPCYYKESPYKYYLCGAYGFKKGSDPLPPLNYWQGYLVDSVSAGLERVVYMSPPAIAISGDPDFGTEYLHLVYEKRWGYPKLPIPGGWLWIVHQQLVYIKTNGFYEVVEGPEVIYEVEWRTIEPLVHPLSPSITLDFNDVPHVAWSLRDTVWYSSKEGGSWSSPFDVSSYYTPASSPFIDYYGGYVSVVWEAIDPLTGKYEIIKRDKRLFDGRWSWGTYVSDTPDNDSRWAQVRGNRFVAWSESFSANNWDILLKDLSTGTLYNISNNTTTSRYSQMEFWQDADGAYLGIAWTDQVEPPYADGAYEILFWTSTFSAAKYYSVEVGQVEASPYTLYRDGYITYPSGISIDWASDELVYRLPYLLSDYDYTLVVVGYHESKGKWNAQVKLDGRKARVLKVEAGVPDTVKMEIPLPYYENDKEIELRVRRLTGDFAGVCDVSLYQFERGSKGGGGTQTATINYQPSTINYQLCQNYPNPFNQKTDIRYQIADNSKVSLKIYNVAGQLVRTLVDETKSAGSHSITWDRKDNSGKEVPAGVYFYRLNAGAETETKRMVVVR